MLLAYRTDSMWSIPKGDNSDQARRRFQVGKVLEQITQENVFKKLSGYINCAVCVKKAVTSGGAEASSTADGFVQVLMKAIFSQNQREK